jgi:hypothetical protein
MCLPRLSVSPWNITTTILWLFSLSGMAYETTEYLLHCSIIGKVQAPYSQERSIFQLENSLSPQWPKTTNSRVICRLEPFIYGNNKIKATVATVIQTDDEKEWNQWNHTHPWNFFDDNSNQTRNKWGYFSNAAKQHRHFERQDQYHMPRFYISPKRAFKALYAILPQHIFCWLVRVFIHNSKAFSFDIELWEYQGALCFLDDAALHFTEGKPCDFPNLLRLKLNRLQGFFEVSQTNPMMLFELQERLASILAQQEVNIKY